MKISPNIVLKSFDGQDLRLQPDPNEMSEILTLRKVITTALLTTLQGEQPSGDESFRNYRLAQRVHESDEVELSVEEVAKIKERIGKLYTPNIAGAAWMALDPVE